MTTEDIARRRDEYRDHLHRCSVTPHTFVRAGMVYELLDLLGAALELNVRRAEGEDAEVVEWLATWLAAPRNPIGAHVLEGYLRRAGYEAQADKLRLVSDRMRGAVT